MLGDVASRVSSPVLIGRDAEVARLSAAIDAARAGRGQVLLVAGEAGVGKTRLITELEAVARPSGVQVLAGGCIPLGDEALAYAPIVEAFRGWIRTSDPTAIRNSRLGRPPNSSASARRPRSPPGTPNT